MQWLRRLLWLPVFVSGAVACSSPARPQSAVPAGTVPVTVQARSEFAGTWRLEGTMTACSGLRDCLFDIGRPASPLTLRLHQTGSQVTGVLSDGTGVLTEVRGDAAAAGRVSLSGALPYSGPGDCPGGFRIDDMTISVVEGQAGGHYQLSSDSADPNCVPAHVTTSVDVTAVTRVSPETAPAGMAGDWRGYMRSTACWIDPARGCDAGGALYAEGFTLAESASGIAGTLPPYNLSVSGRVEGNAVILTSDYTKTTNDGFTKYRMLSSSLERDDMGRLTGSFVFRRDAYVAGALVASYDVTVELWRFALVQR